MNKFLPIGSLLLLASVHPVCAQINIPNQASVTEQFNTIGAAAGALPANWKMSAAGNGAAATWATAGNITATTQAANSGSPAAGGAYNWGTSAGSDRAIGFMTSGSYASPNAIMAYYRNATGATVTSITVSFSVERYRINTSAFSLNFFSSTDGSAWTARPAGDVGSSVFAPGVSSYTFGAPQSLYRTVTITGLNIASNSDIYLRWVLNTGSSNAQGIGLDDVTVFAGTATPVVSAALQDTLAVDNNGNGQVNVGDKLTYKATIRNRGSGDATTVLYNNPTPFNTTASGTLRSSALARDDNFTTPLNTVLNGTTVLANDYGLPSLSVASFGPVGNATTTANGSNSAGTNSGGTVVMQANGTFSYTPATGFNGNDKFSYIATTGNLPDNSAVVTIAVGAQPTATNDNYSVTGNIGINPSAALGMLVNDAGNGTVASVNGNAANVGTGITTAQGGSLTVNADGSFSYQPAAGFEGADQFTYTTDNGFGNPSAAATVTLTVSGMVWFVDNNYTGAQVDGRLGTPFKTLAAFQALNNNSGNNPGNNDNIFLYESNTDYTGAVTLLNGQKLIGQDAGADLATVAGITAQAYTLALPAMNSGNAVKVTIVATAATTNAVNLSAAGSNTIRGLTLGNTTGAGISGSGFGTLTVADVAKSGSGAALILSNGTMNGTFTNITSTSAATAISLTGMAGNTTASAGALSGSTAGAVLINGGTLSFAYNGGITQSDNAAMVTVNNGHNTGTIAFNTGTLSATNGTGLQFDNADGIYNFNGTVTLNGANAGVDIINSSAGTFTFTNTAITNPSGVAFLVNGGNGNITHAGAMTKNNTGRLVDIQGRNGGTLSLNGNLSSTASSSGILVTGNTGGTIAFNGSTKTLNTGTATPLSLTNNTGATINFGSGGMVVNTTSAIGMDVSGGGTVTVTGTGNTIASTSATALSVVNTNIGAGGLVFTSINTAGVVTGISLNNTGSAGGLMVTGTGTTSGSGGTIQNCSQRGARFVNSANVNLANMNFTGNGTANIDPPATGGDALNGTNTNVAAGIDLQTVAGVTLTNVAISGGVQIGLNGKGVSNLVMSNSSVLNAGNENLEDGVQLANLSGTCSINNCNFTGNFHRQLEIQNSTGILNLTVTGTTFNRNAYLSTAAQGMLIAGRLTANITASVKSSIFQSNFGSGFFGQSIDNAVVNLTLGGNGLVSTPADGNTFINNSGAFQIATDNASSMTFSAGNNTHTVTSTVTSGFTPFNVRKGTNATGPVSATLGFNTIGNTTALSGNNCAGCNGMSFTDEGLSGGMSLRVSNNTIQHVNQRGMEFLMQLNDQMSAVITNNIFPSHDGTIGHAIFAQSGTDAADNGSICMEISGNNITGTWDNSGATGNIRLRKFPVGTALTTFRIRNLAGGTTTDVINFLNANNTNAQATATTDQANTNYLGGAAACP